MSRRQASRAPCSDGPTIMVLLSMQQCRMSSSMARRGASGMHSAAAWCIEQKVWAATVRRAPDWDTHGWCSMEHV